MVGLLGQVHQATGEVLAELNLGGGFGIAYLAEDDPVSPHDVAAKLRAVIAAECAAARACPCRGWPSSRAGRSPGRAR